MTTPYINYSEIPGELSQENMISSHVKRSPLLWLLHIKSRLSHQKMVLYFIGVYIINTTWPLGDTKVLRVLNVSTFEGKFSPRS